MQQLNNNPATSRAGFGRLGYFAHLDPDSSISAPVYAKSIRCAIAVNKESSDFAKVTRSTYRILYRCYAELIALLWHPGRSISLA